MSRWQRRLSDEGIEYSCIQISFCLYYFWTRFFETLHSFSKNDFILYNSNDKELNASVIVVSTRNAPR